MSSYKYPSIIRLQNLAGENLSSLCKSFAKFENCLYTSYPTLYEGCPEVEIYERKKESKKTRKHAFDHESDQEKKEKN